MVGSAGRRANVVVGVGAAAGAVDNAPIGGPGGSGVSNQVHSVLIVLSAIYIFLWFGFGNMLSHFFDGVWYMIYAVFFLVVGILGLRIGAEVTLAVFEIHEKLGAGPTTTTTSSTSTPS